MYKNLKTPAFEYLENGNYHVYRKLSCKTAFFKMDPSARNLQQSGNKPNKIKEIRKLTELSNYVYQQQTI